MEENNIKLLKYVGIAILVVVIVVVVVYYVGKKSGKEDETVALPSATDWGKSLTEAENNEIKKHAEALYSDMKGIKLGIRDESTYNSYLASSDRVFVGTANYFAEKYGEGENIATWFDNESYNFLNIKLKERVKTILSRLSGFGINPE
jgi:hypothetical protein